MPHHLRFLPSCLAGVSLLVLAACGGGGDGSSVVAPPVTGVTPPADPPVSAEAYVTVSGAIDGFGSVIVNGVRYNTDSAEVRKDDRVVDLSELSVGQIVALRAKRGAREGELPTALRVRYEEVLEGPVDNVAEDGRSLVILGQTVFLTDGTIFEDDLDPGTIAVGNVLEVSGSFTADGDIVASYVEISDDVDGDYEVHGTVGGLDEAAQTFRVKGLKVGYATAELADFEDGNVLSNGDKVEVEGSVFTNDGTLIATRVEYEGDDLDDLMGEEADDDDEEEAEIEGFITAFTDATDFVVADTPVRTDGDTEFARCTPDDLGLDVEVEVEGVMDEAGVLLADAVKCEVEANIFYESRVEAVDPDGGTLDVLGLSVATDADTAFKDKSDARIREFGLDDIAIGDVVRIQAYALGDGGPRAKRVVRERDNRFDGPEVKGDVSAITADDVIIAGVTAVLTEDTQYALDDDEGVSPEAFFEIVQLGDRLVARGTLAEDGRFLVERLERDDDDDDDDGEGDDD